MTFIEAIKVLAKGDRITKTSWNSDREVSYLIWLVPSEEILKVTITKYVDKYFDVSKKVYKISPMELYFKRDSWSVFEDFINQTEINDEKMHWYEERHEERN